MSVRFSPDFLVLAAVLVLTGAAAASAQTLTSRVAAIEAALASGAAEDALQQARDLHHEVAAQAGFGVRQAVLTEELATGFGIYTPRAQPVYAPGAPVFGYVEPFGYSLQPGADGLNAMVFDIDFALLTPAGEALTDITPMGVVELSSRSRPLDAYFHLTYQITGPEGEYLIWTRVTDRPSGQEAEFTIPVSFGAAPSAGLSK